MSKIVGILIDIAVAVTVSVVMFTFVPVSAGTFTVSYIFLLVAIVMQIVPFFICQIEQNVVYKASYIMCSVFYLLIQSIISIAAVVVFSEKIAQTIGLSIVMLLLYCILLTVLFNISMQGRKEEKRQEEKSKFIKTVLSALEICKQNFADLELHKMCNDTMEQIRYSSIMSGKAMTEIEKQIQNSAMQLEIFSRERRVNDCKEECRSLLMLIQERNHKIKLYMEK